MAALVTKHPDFVSSDEVELVAPIDPQIAAAARRRVAVLACGEDDPRAAFAEVLAMLGLDGAPAPKARRNNREPAGPAQAAPADARGRAALVWRSPEWMDRAGCGGALEPEDWYPVGSSDAGEDARRVCGWCPVREDCCAYAVEHHLADGIWGGYRLDIPAERKALRDRDSPASPVPVQTCAQCGREFTERQTRTRCRACVQGLEPADSARECLADWRALGATFTVLASASGVPAYVLQAIASGRTTSVTPERKRAILAITGVWSAVPA